MTDETLIEQDENAPEPTLRDELAKAFDQADEPAPAPESAAEQPEPAETPGDPRARDEHGRFTKGPAKAEGDHGAAPEVEARSGAKPAGGTPPVGQPVKEQAAPAAPPTPADRAPQSWKPLAREHWTKLPNEVKAEVARREREVAHTLQESAQARQLADSFRQTIGPFEAMIRAEGGEPMRAVASLLQTAAALRTAPPTMRAQLVANIVKTFGVPIDALDAALVGEVPQQHQAPTYQDPRVDQLLARLEAQEQARNASVVQEAEAQVEAFAQGREFFNDLRPLMADVIEIASKRGERLTLDDAYARALAMSPDISKVMQQREAARAAATAKAATQRAMAAASSVRGSAPVPAQQRGGGNLRDDLEAAFDSANNR